MGNEATKPQLAHFEAQKDEETPPPVGLTLQIKDSSFHGCPQEVTAVAYNDSQGVLALGTSEPKVHLYYGANAQSMLSPEGGLVRHLCFVGDFLLVCVMSDGSLLIYDWLSSNQVGSLHGRWLNTDVTAVHGAKNHYMYLAAGNTLHVIQAHPEPRLCAYQVEPSDAGLLSEEAGDLIAVQSNPMEPGELALAYEDGHVVFWDVNKRRATKTYSFNKASSINESEEEEDDDGAEARKVTCIEWHHQGKTLYVALHDGTIHAIRKDKTVNNVVWDTKGESSDPDEPLWVERMQFRVGAEDTPLLVVQLRAATALYEVSRSSVVFLSFTGDETSRHEELFSVAANMNLEHIWARLVFAPSQSEEGATSTSQAHLLLLTQTMDASASDIQCDVRVLKLPNCEPREWSLDLAGLDDPSCMQGIAYQEADRLTTFKTVPVNLGTPLLFLLAQRLLIGNNPVSEHADLLRPVVDKVVVEGDLEVESMQDTLRKILNGSAMNRTLEMAFVGTADGAVQIYAVCAPIDKAANDHPSLSFSSSGLCEFCGVVEPAQDPLEVMYNPVTHIEYVAGERSDEGGVLLVAWANGQVKLYACMTDVAASNKPRSAGTVPLPILHETKITSKPTCCAVIPAHKAAYICSEEGEITEIRWVHSGDELIAAQRIWTSSKEALEGYVVCLTAAPTWDPLHGARRGLYAGMSTGALACLDATTGELLYAMVCPPKSALETVMQQYPNSSYVFCTVLDRSHRSIVTRPGTHTADGDTATTPLDTQSDKQSQTSAASPTSSISPQPAAKRRMSGMFRKDREAAMQAAAAAAAAEAAAAASGETAIPADAPAWVLFVLGNSVVLFDVNPAEMGKGALVRSAIVRATTISASAIVAATAISATVVADGSTRDFVMCVEEEVRLTAFDVMSRSVVATLDMSPEIGLLPIQAASMNGDGLLHVKRGSKGITRATYANVDPAVAWKIPRALRAASVIEGNFASSGGTADRFSTAKRSRMSLSRMTFSRSSTLVVDYDKIFGASIDVDEAASQLERQQAELFGNAQRGQRGQGGPDVAGAQSAINEAYQSLKDRGERLEQLTNKTANLQEAARIYRERTKELRALQEQRNRRLF